MSRAVFAEAGLAALQALLDRSVAEGRVPAAVGMLAAGGDLGWVGVAGEMGPGVPMQPDAILPLASIGKMHTATVAMALVERGALAVDDPVSGVLPEYAATAAPGDPPITVHHLLTHTGGLRVGGDGFRAVWDEHAGKTTTRDLARALAGLPLASRPGTTFDYGETGASYEVLAALLEVVAGRTLEELVAELIVEPLGLEDTHFFVPEHLALRMPASHRRGDRGLEVARPYGQAPPRSSFLHGGGGIAASAADLARFAGVFLGGGAGVLGSGSVELMTADHLGELSPVPGRGWGYGAGIWFREAPAGGGIIRRYGWIGGGHSIFWAEPSEGVAAYLGLPLEPPGDPGLLAEFDGLVGAARA